MNTWLRNSTIKQTLGGGLSLQQHQLAQSARESSKAFPSGGMATPQDRCGLIGLVGVIKMTRFIILFLFQSN